MFDVWDGRKQMLFNKQHVISKCLPNKMNIKNSEAQSWKAIQRTADSISLSSRLSNICTDCSWNSSRRPLPGYRFLCILSTESGLLSGFTAKAFEKRTQL